MATIHGPSCRCPSCRARRAVSQSAPQSENSGHGEVFLAPSTAKPESEISDDDRKAIQNDPVEAVIAFMIDDAERDEILRVLALCGIDGERASNVIKQAEERYADGGVRGGAKVCRVGGLTD